MLTRWLNFVISKRFRHRWENWF